MSLIYRDASAGRSVLILTWWVISPTSSPVPNYVTISSWVFYFRHPNFSILHRNSWSPLQLCKHILHHMLHCESISKVYQQCLNKTRRFVICGWGLLCSTHIPNLKCLRLLATKKWKATPNVKILVLSHPLGDLRLTHRVHLRIDGKRIINFLLAIIELFRYLSRLRHY